MYPLGDLKHRDAEHKTRYSQPVKNPKCLCIDENIVESWYMYREHHLYMVNMFLIRNGYYVNESYSLRTCQNTCPLNND